VVEEEHALSWGVLVAYALFVISTNVLSKPLQTHKGSFIGYSAHIFYFLCVNLAFTFVELTYGALSNSNYAPIV
jgi:zinc transporter 5/7